LTIFLANDMVGAIIFSTDNISCKNKLKMVVLLNSVLFDVPLPLFLFPARAIKKNSC